MTCVACRPRCRPPNASLPAWPEATVAAEDPERQGRRPFVDPQGPPPLTAIRLWLAVPPARRQHRQRGRRGGVRNGVRDLVWNKAMADACQAVAPASAAVDDARPHEMGRNALGARAACLTRNLGYRRRSPKLVVSQIRNSASPLQGRGRGSRRHTYARSRSKGGPCGAERCCRRRPQHARFRLHVLARRLAL
jgi:hypothetical protein